MEDLDIRYWRKRKGILSAAGAVGFAAFTFLWLWMPSRNGTFLLAWFLINPLLCSPFRLKTAAGRLWWTTYFLAIGSGFAAVRLGIHHPLAWVCAVIAACAYAIGVCLRWKPPPSEEWAESLLHQNSAPLPAKMSLLRAASEPDVPTDKVLLRAAAASQETPSEQLLRASGNATNRE